MHTTVGFVLSLLLAYRTNTAYDRWWKEEKLWVLLVNNSRNLALKLSAYLSDEKIEISFKKVIPAYASVLSKHLLNEEVSKMLFEGLDLEIDHHKHRPNQVAKCCFKKQNDLYQSGKLRATNLSSSILNCNRLPIFVALANVLKTRQSSTRIVRLSKIHLLFVMTLPFGFVFSLGYYVIPVVIFIFYVLASLELIAEEIEDPLATMLMIYR